MNWTLPNILTVLRLLAAPAVLLVFVVLPRPWADWTAVVLFIGGSLTDWVDGHLARSWNQQTKLGTMLDPIADKAMVIIALAAVMGLNGMSGMIVIPATVILFREVFVSGLREYLGDTAGTLKVTKLAKWKTTIQMVAIAILLLHGVFEQNVDLLVSGMRKDVARDVLAGLVRDDSGLTIMNRAMILTWFGGVACLWLAAVLTAITGWDYFNKALPYLKD
ncbi:CDP-diacylglycerol--glycerol-3-phosphate 3-phosphatidyltransferase [Tropicimonas sp.]|uniref:CDP-diacylglycerol--glycerol-3-phosphate 3-phosphatidyltransferase n=1 Tax=Tropicimonas sp. TaxID=2067044 RepID=UPI003A841C31